jgi:hypothetical protein
MANNFFDDTTSELDLLEEASDLEDFQEEAFLEESSYAEQEYSQEDVYLEEEQEDISSRKPSYSLNKQEKNVVSEAMLRLEQARLYEMLLKHNFFEGVRVNLSAKQNVEQELKKFILDRLEVLLGIKQEVQQTNSSEIMVDLPFNDIEVDFLKALAYKGTNGDSLSSPSSQVQAIVRSTTQSTVQSLPRVKQRQEGLRPLSQPKQIQAPARQPVRQLSKPTRPSPRSQNQQQPVKQQPKATSKKAPRTLDQIAKEDLENMRNRKPVHEMSAKELAAANKKIEGGGSRARPANAIPMPTAEQQVTNILTTKAANGSRGGNDFNSILSKALGAVPLETISDD